MIWNGESAASLIDKLGFRCHHRKTKTANFSITEAQVREISIPITRRNGVTAYINRYSATGKVFPIEGIDGIDVEKLYPRGHEGKNGNPGIAGSVVRHNSSLDPKNNDVLRVDVHNAESLRRLLVWYRS